MEALNLQLLRIFDWLLWTTIQGSVLIIVIFLLQLILRRRLPVRWHYLLWILLLIRLAVPWLPESKMSIFNLVPQFIQQGRIIESFSQSRSSDRMGFYMYGRYADDPQKIEESENLAVRFVRALPVIWLTGTVIIAGYILLRSIRLWRIVKRERLITDSEILDLLEDCKMQMNVQTIIGIVVSDRIKSPALFGFIRPRLLLPQGILETFSHEELRYVFIHELCHLKQRDIYLGWLMALLHILHWFNPLMWFAFGRMRADRELACDRLAISTMGPDEPPKYGRTIVNLLESFSHVRYLPSVAGIVEDTCQIERRIKMIVDYKKTSRTRWAGAMLLLAVLACVVLTDAYVAKADFAFGTPTNLGPPISSWANEISPNISTDGLQFYITQWEAVWPGGYGGEDIWLSTRVTTDDQWEEPVNLGPMINSSSNEEGASISTDGLALYFSSNRPGGHGGCDLWVTTREKINDDWGPPQNLGPTVNSAANEAAPFLSADGLQLYFMDWGVLRPGGCGGIDIWVTTRTTRNDEWGIPVNLGPPVNSPAHDKHASISSDGLTLFFCSTRSGGHGGGDLYVTRRITTEDPWCEPVNLGQSVNTSGWDEMPSISADGSTLYFATDHRTGYGGYDIWQVSILPIVDFNGDGNIDTDDLVILVNSWGTNERLCDIGPTPLGDGIVDMEDLKVFMSYWEQENMPEVP